MVADKRPEFKNLKMSTETVEQQIYCNSSRIDFGYLYVVSHGVGCLFLDLKAALE